jgi:hypothetical protein
LRWVNSFFLSTIDHQSRPTVSYKGDDSGFVRVVDSKVVVFPCYDGNGMFYSMGNLLGNPQVGMLFIDFEKPHRLRLSRLPRRSRGLRTNSCRSPSRSAILARRSGDLERNDDVATICRMGPALAV